MTANEFMTKMKSKGFDESQIAEFLHKIGAETLEQNDIEYFIALYGKTIVRGGNAPHSRGMGWGRYTTQWTHGIEGNSGSRQDWGK